MRAPRAGRVVHARPPSECRRRAARRQGRAGSTSPRSTRLPVGLASGVTSISPALATGADADVARAAAARPTRLQFVLAFASVYVVWGSTYLAMRVAVQGLPPFLIGGVRFLTAGVLLGAWVAWRERPGWPSRRTWAWAVATGALLFIGGNGGVLWAGRTVPSGVVAAMSSPNRP